MKTFCYLSLIPESLIASALDPEAFALYYATGSQRRSRSQAIFLEVDPDLLKGNFPVEEIDNRGMTHSDGSPRRSLYLDIYRVLERIPFEALGKLYLSTANGKLLAIESQEFRSSSSEAQYLYQDLAPVTPLIASTLEPRAFGQSITNPKHTIHLPCIAFCDLDLGPLANDNTADMVDNLPYPNIDHLKDCLQELVAKANKTNKTVHRGMRAELLYRTVKNGFFIANSDRLLHYPMPSHDALERDHFDWWRSAQRIY